MNRCLAIRGTAVTSIMLALPFLVVLEGSQRCLGSTNSAETTQSTTADSPDQYQANPFVITLQQDVPEKDNRGSLFACELDGDGQMDFLVTSPGAIGAYGHNGKLLWLKHDDIRLS